jgi:Holliday junction DNA helicase RuvA
MISQLRGTLVSKDASCSLIDVSGVGYEVATSLHTFSQLPDIEQPVNIYTHFVVREDAQLLYGFYQAQERELFRKLIKINGVGPKVALAVLSHMQVGELITAVNTQDLVKFTAVPGIGKKTAQRLLIELADKLKDLHITASTTDLLPVVVDKQQEVTAALIHLGYQSKQIASWLERLDISLSVEEMLKQVLQAIGKGK